MKRKTMISSILVIVLCLGLISGSTFALFTSTSSVNIAVTSGKVDVKASLKTPLELYSANASVTTTDGKAIKTTDTSSESADGILTGTFAGTYYYQSQPQTFLNGGTASYTAPTLTIDRMTPGDKVATELEITNKSNVAIKYRLKIAATAENDANAKILEVLKVRFEGKLYTGLKNYASSWTTKDALANNASETYKSTIEIIFPLDVDGEDYMDKTVELAFTVEAVQSNANTVDAGTVEYVSPTAPVTQIATVSSVVTEPTQGTTTATLVAATAPTTEEKTTEVTLTNVGQANNTVKLTVETHDISAAAATQYTIVSGNNVAAGSIDLTLTVNDTVVSQFANNASAKIVTYVAKGLSDVKVVYNGDNTKAFGVGQTVNPKNSKDAVTDVGDYFYDSSTGELVFITDHFSEYVVTTSAKVLVVETNTGYNTLQTAVDAAVNGNTIALLNNIEFATGESLLINKEITLDLGNKSITGNNDPMIVIGSTVSTYKVSEAVLSNSGHLKIRGKGSISNPSQWDAFVVFEGSVLDIYDGNYSGLKTAIYVNGGTFNSYGGNYTVTAVDGAKAATNYIVCVESQGVANIYAGNYTTPDHGCYGVYLTTASVVNFGSNNSEGPTFNTWRSCISSNGSASHEVTINIYSGTFTANRDDGSAKDKNVIQLANQTSETQTLNIYGGHFKQTGNDENSSIFNVRYNGTIDINIRGGEFVASRYFNGVAGSTYPSNENVHVTVDNDAIPTENQDVLVYDYTTSQRIPEKDFELTIKIPVAKIGDVKYTKIQDAVDAAQNNDIIQVVADHSVNSTINVPEGLTVKLDLNGHTITGDASPLIQNYGNLSILGNNGTISNTNVILRSDAKYILKDNSTIYINHANFGDNDPIDQAGLTYLQGEGKVLLEASDIDDSYVNLGWVNFPPEINNTGYGCYWYAKQSDVEVYNAQASVVGGTYNSTNGYVFRCQTATSLTIEDATINSFNGLYSLGNLTVTNTSVSTNGSYHVMYIGAGTATINSGTFIRQAANFNGDAIHLDSNAVVNVYGGTFSSINTTTTAPAKALNFEGSSNGATINIYGGSMNGDIGTNGTNVSVNFIGGNHNFNSLALYGTNKSFVITGGTYNKDVSSYVPSGYSCVNNGEIWTVSAE